MKCSIKNILISALYFLLSALPLNACPLCAEAIGAVHGLARGIFWSTLLMLAVPFFVIAVISSLIVKANRQNKP